MPDVDQWARRHIADMLCKCLMPRAKFTRVPIVVRDLPDTAGIDVPLAREILREDQRFLEKGKRFDLAIRNQVRDLSFARAIEHLFADLGRPVDTELACRFFATTSKRDVEYYRPVIAKLAERQNSLVESHGTLLPASWLLFPEDDNIEDVLFFCDLQDNEEINLYRPLLADEALRGDNLLETAVRIVQEVGERISNKVLDFFVFSLHIGEFDAVELLRQMLCDERVYALAQLHWTTGRVGRLVTEHIDTLNQRANSKAPEHTADIDKILLEPLPPDHPGYFIQDDDLQLIYQRIHSATEPLSIEALLYDILEIYPGDSGFAAAVHSVHALLNDDPSIVNADDTSFTGRAAAPDWAKQIPRPLVPDIGPEDVVLQLEGLAPGLADIVQDPYLDDYYDNDVRVDEGITTEDETFYPIVFPHRVAGTIRVRQMDRTFFGIPASVVPITVIDDEGNEYEPWLNADDGLIVGLNDLYTNLDLMPGDLLAITRGENEREFTLEYAGEDEKLVIGRERFEELIQLRERAQAQNWSVFKSLCEVMAAHPDGVMFETLYSQVNVVRRATRLQLASLLTYYLCFRCPDNSGETWIFTERAVEAGTVRTKDKYIIEHWGVAE